MYQWTREKLKKLADQNVITSLYIKTEKRDTKIVWTLQIQNQFGDKAILVRSKNPQEARLFRSIEEVVRLIEQVFKHYSRLDIKLYCDKTVWQYAKSVLDEMKLTQM